MRKLFADTEPLKNQEFRRLWLGGAVTVVGSQLTVFAVPVQIFALTQSSAFVGLSGVFALVPLIVFGLWGGALADAMDQRKLMLISSAGLGVSSLLLWLQAAAGVNNVWVILVLLAIQQAFFAVNSPTRNAILPRILPPEQLPSANALNSTVFQAGAIAGPVLAGVLLRWLSLSELYLIDALALTATLWAVYLLRPLPASLARNRVGLREVLDGFRYLGGHQLLLMSFLVDIIAMVFGMPRILFPEMAYERFGGPIDGGTALALLSGAMSAGAVLGGVFSGWLPKVRRQGFVVVVSIWLWGAAMVAFGLATGFGHGTMGLFFWLALIFLAAGGAADMVSAAFRSAMLQSAASDEVRGRLQGVFLVVVAGGPRIGDVAHGFAADHVGTTWATAGGGVLVIVGVLIAVVVFPVFIRYRAGTRLAD